MDLEILGIGGWKFVQMRDFQDNTGCIKQSQQ